VTEAEKIAAGLTEGQRKVVLALPADGSFGPASSHTRAKYMWWGIGARRTIRLIEHQHCTDNSWCLNPRGLAVRKVLERQS
jgi:hypothetical protein